MKRFKQYWHILNVSNPIPEGKQFLYWVILFLLIHRLMDYTMKDLYSASSLGILSFALFSGIAMIDIYRESYPQILDFVPITSRQQVNAYLVMVLKIIVIISVFLLIIGGSFVTLSLFQSNSNFDFFNNGVSVASFQGMIFHILMVINLFAIVFLSIFFTKLKHRILCVLSGFGLVWLMVIYLVNQIGAYKSPKLYQDAGSDYVLNLFGHQFYYGGNLEEWFYTIPSSNRKLIMVGCITVVISLICYFGACQLNKPKRYE